MNRAMFSTCSRILYACLLVTIAVSFLSGCAHSYESEAEVRARHDDVVKTNFMQIQDDLDYFFMLDRPSRLSKRYIR